MRCDRLQLPMQLSNYCSNATAGKHAHVVQHAALTHVSNLLRGRSVGAPGPSLTKGMLYNSTVSISSSRMSESYSLSLEVGLNSKVDALSGTCLPFCSGLAPDMLASAEKHVLNTMNL